MKNFINVRLKSVNHYKEITDIQHNMRTIKIDSKFEKTADNMEDWRKWKNTFLNMQNDKPLKILRKMRKEYNEKYLARTGRNLTNSKPTLIGGIITFSEKSSLDLGNEYTKEDFENTNKKAIEDLAAELKTEVLYITFHYDEKTPHVHYHLKNFDNNGMAIWNNETKKMAGKLQDIAFENLKILGMERGIKKEITGAVNQKTSVYFSKLIKKQREELRGINKELKEIRNIITKEKDLNKEEKKKIYEEISKIQKDKRLLQKNTEELKIENSGYKNELRIFEKMLNNEKLEQEEKEVLKILAPNLFQFIENSTQKKKQALDNAINKHLTM